MEVSRQSREPSRPTWVIRSKHLEVVGLDVVIEALHALAGHRPAAPRPRPGPRRPPTTGRRPHPAPGGGQRPGRRSRPPGPRRHTWPVNLRRSRWPREGWKRRGEANLERPCWRRRWRTGTPATRPPPRAMSRGTRRWVPWPEPLQGAQPAGGGHPQAAVHVAEVVAEEQPDEQVVGPGGQALGPQAVLTAHPHSVHAVVALPGQGQQPGDLGGVFLQVGVDGGHLGGAGQGQTGGQGGALAGREGMRRQVMPSQWASKAGAGVLGAVVHHDDLGPQAGSQGGEAGHEAGDALRLVVERHDDGQRRRGRRPRRPGAPKGGLEGQGHAPTRPAEEARACPSRKMATGWCKSRRPCSSGASWLR